MRSHSQEVLESSRPDGEAKELLDFCLARLYEDDEHDVEDEIVNGLTFEELIGALLESKDDIARLEESLDYAHGY